MNIKLFKPYGPYAIHIKEGTIEADNFWIQNHKLADQHGCYIFAIRSGGGITPWYVGKTARTFQQEVFTDRNLAKFYYPILGKIKKGTPVLLFSAASKKTGGLPKNIIDEMETFLIQQGLNVNPKLLNSRKVKLPRFGIRGVIRGGKGNIGASAGIFRATMAID